ncbi:MULTISPECIES: DUF4189 domain-containing protein [unclassified Mycobacterium]|jgi:hypothetical protein|uniref:DUF4189 domain-containing protein n=1 Tax=unclassified Mycobacterium TaxID=2642494 RepID=UPI0029C5FE44|nr:MULTISPECIES: DUF4189 domain-containing protein [unclassified Mycobacterium]
MTTTLKTPRRRMIAATMLAAAAVTGAIGTAVPANAAPAKYIAIAYSPATGQLGRAQATNLDAALAGSLSQCGGHCAVETWSKNGCVALAVSGQYHYGWYGANLRDAQQGAMQRTGPGSYVVWSGCAN